MIGEETLNVGQIVTWKRGSRIKRGTVTAVIAPEYHPDRSVYPELVNEKGDLPGVVQWTSYVVKPEGAGAGHNGNSKHYWVRSRGVQALSSFEDNYKEPERYTFVCGDKVRWSYRAGGLDTVRVGEVAEVLAAGERPSSEKYGRIFNGHEPGPGRDHVSYVVKCEVPYKKRKRPPKSKYFWPLVSLLRPVESSNGDAEPDQGTAEPVVPENQIKAILEGSPPMTPWEQQAAAEAFWSEFGANPGSKPPMLKPEPGVPDNDPVISPGDEEEIKELEALSYDFGAWLKQGQRIFERRDAEEHGLVRFILEEYSGMSKLGIKVTDEQVSAAIGRYRDLKV